MTEKVLIVDDDQEFLDLLSERLILRGLEIETAQSAPSALSLLQDKSFDVILLDLQMPEMNGMEALEQLSTLKPHQNIIMLTGHATVASGVQAMQLGAADVLEKPVDIDVLLQKIQIAASGKVGRRYPFGEIFTEDHFVQNVGRVQRLTDSFNLTDTPAPHVRYVFIDTGNPVAKVLKDVSLLYEPVRIDPKIRRPSGWDIVIEGLPDSIDFGPYASLGDRVVIRSDETDPANGHRFSIHGSIKEGSVLHWKWNYIGKGVMSDPFVTFHGSKIGTDVLIGSRTVLDTACELPDNCEVGDACYIAGPITTSMVPSGTVLFGGYMIQLPAEAVELQKDQFQQSFTIMRASVAKDHKYNKMGIGFFDPLAYVESFHILSPKVKNLYIGPFAHIKNCEFDGPNINIQDHNIRKATFFGGYNIGAHGVWTNNVKMEEYSATLFHCMLENVNLGKGSVAGPLTTIRGRSSYDRITIPDNYLVCGYVTHETFPELLQNGELYEGGQLRAILKPRAEFDANGLGDRLSHIDDENAMIHANKKRNIIAVPAATYFSRKNIGLYGRKGTFRSKIALDPLGLSSPSCQR
jgi:CheY-like chemotaxis protein/carbonic anhydrase/acetyltransferase-like protein (isoleucine patch superfamily)